MIRVVYRWRIDRQHQPAFAAWWHERTLVIRASEPGAMGSTLLAVKDDDDHVVGIARWQSEAQLSAFWERVSPLVFEGAVLESLEILTELDHLTLEAEQ